ncbi:hypothetical protein FQA39_LY09592 [Lamprigera yunnana]|nr:hypothetical protein FQA39_LY09592 [Lamprigera yunnana]
MNSVMLNKFEENNQKFEEINKKLEEKMLNKFEENSKKFEETNEKLEENNQKLEEKMLNKFEENNKKLDETRTEIRTEMDQSMEKIQRQFLTIQERINERWEKKYVEVDSKMEEIQEQVDNNSVEINGICERLREQGTKLINVEAKINQHKEERIQVCEDLKEQKREIVNYIEEEIKIGNGTGHNVTTNYIKIEREAPKFHPSKNQHPKVYVQELQTYLEVIKKQIGNQHDQAMKDAIIREATREETETWYRTKCERDRKRLDGSKYYNRGCYNNYQYGKYNHGGQERDNYNYTRGLFHGNQFYHNNNNRNQRFQDKIHTDLENRRGKEEMIEPLKDMKMKIRTIDKVEEM